MKLSLGFSPCPNDTFIFDALVNHKIDAEGFEFDVTLADVETLNEWCSREKLDITKLSFPSLFSNANNYHLLNAGSALGNGVGPLLISATKISPHEIDIATRKIAIPGTHTTANLLLSFAFPAAVNKLPMLFSEIENAVLRGETELGVIIHENRFTYHQKGLHKVLDLGEYWQEKMELPIPLGCIAIRKALGGDVAEKINSLIMKSLSFAFDHYPAIPYYVKQHAQEMNEEVMRQHIELYVNHYTMDLGENGRLAIGALEKTYRDMINSHAVPPTQLFT